MNCNVLALLNFFSGVFIIQEMMLTPEWKVFSTHKSNVCTFKFGEIELLIFPQETWKKLTMRRRNFQKILIWTV